MKVIFLENVKGLGRKGEVKNVADGYFMNYLSPKKLARVATSELIKQVEKKLEKEVIEKDRLKEQARMVKEKLESSVLELKGKANGQSLYASIGTDDIIKALVDKIKIRLDKHNFIENVHLKELGDYTVEIKLSEGVKANLRVNIKANPV